MADKRKDLAEIRPARSRVKIKSRKAKAPEEKPLQPKVVKNVQPPSQAELNPPTEEAARILSRLNDAKVKLVDNMKAFNQLLNDKKLSENRSMKEKDYEQEVVNNLAVTAMEVERLSPGEGMLGMSILAIRQALSLRDAGNSLAYELHKVKKELEQIKNDIYEEVEDGEEA